MADVRPRAPPILYYTAVSVVLLGVVVARALDRYQNFFAAAFALSHSNGSILVMANMGILCLYLVGRATQLLFFGALRPVEIERLYQRGGFFVTDFMLAFATFREAFGVSSGVLVAILLFIKCFHWLLADRIEAIDQVPYPGPKRLEHARMIALFFVLWIVDLVLLTYSIDAAMQQGMGLIVLFATEYAILMVNLTQSLLKYILSLYEIRRAAALGGPLAPSWEEKPIYGFYIELSTTFIELLIYVSYFVAMSIFHSIPVYAIRDVYVSGSLFFSRTLAFIRYKRALRALDVFPTPTHEELESKSDKTCIVCREELVLPTPAQPAANTEGQSDQNPAPSSPSEPDMSNGPPKRLPCGHIFHLSCLRSWFERQLTCPTCRTRVDEPQARGANAGGGIGREGIQGGQGGDNARPQQPGAHQDGLDAGRAQPGAQNRNGGRQGDGIANPAVQMREPLRFEGFYLQPGAYVPWVGGPMIPRDPTISTAQQLQRIANGLQQRPRHTPLPSTSSTANHLQTAIPSATPVPPTVQSPTSALNPGTPTFPQSWPTAAAASSASPIPDKIIKPSMTPKRASVALASDGETSSEESSEENTQTTQERRRLMAEAALKRHQASFSRFHSTASNPGTPPRPSSSIMPLSPADHSTIKSPTERAYDKYFALPQEPTLSESTTPTQQWKPYMPNSLRSQITPNSSVGQYTVRNDAPSFIPLFHQFHIPVYGPATGTVRTWPLQSANFASQTLPMPSIQNPSAPAMTRPNSYRDSRSPSITANLPQAVPHPNSSINPSLLRASSSLPPRDIKREASPTQELSLRHLDSITRQLVEERLRVLENVKRITQQCIDDLTAVRGSPVNLETLRPGQTLSKPHTEQDSGSSEAAGAFSGTPIESTPPLPPLLSPTSKAEDLLMTDFPRNLDPMQSPGVIPPTPLEPVEPLLASKELELPLETVEPPVVVEEEVRMKEESD